MKKSRIGSKWEKIVASLLIILLFIMGCSNESKISNLNLKNENDKELIKSNGQTGDFIEEKGIIIDKLRFKDEHSSGEILKNKLTKTAEVKINFVLNDSDEYVNFFGESVSMTPFFVNLACGVFAIAFFNESALKELQEGGNLTIETKEENPLEGYKIKKSYIEFLDFEEKVKIADCTATGPSWESIKFNSYREYNLTFFGAQIGKKLEENSEDLE